MRIIGLAMAIEIAAVVHAGRSSSGSSMVQVRAGLGLMPTFTDKIILPKELTASFADKIMNLPRLPDLPILSSLGATSMPSPPNSAQLAAVTAAAAAANANFNTHQDLQDRLIDSLQAGKQAIAEDRRMLKLPEPAADAPMLNQAPTMNQMLTLAATQHENSVSMDKIAAAAPIQKVPKAQVAFESNQDDLTELIATGNQMHMQASASTRRVADALAGAVDANQEAQTLEEQAAELRANASLVLQRGAAFAEKASADIAKQTAQTALQHMSEIEQQAESAEIGAASYRAKANSDNQQANTAVSNMYHALNMSNTK